MKLIHYKEKKITRKNVIQFEYMSKRSENEVTKEEIKNYCKRLDFYFRNKNNKIRHI